MEETPRGICTSRVLRACQGSGDLANVLGHLRRARRLCKLRSAFPDPQTPGDAGLDEASRETGATWCEGITANEVENRALGASAPEVAGRAERQTHSRPRV